jgi:tetratricopeptide (TPR) repeat protein
VAQHPDLGYIQTWYDRDIQPGEAWQHGIEMHLNAADLILPLISHDFLASDYCWSVEMQHAMQKFRNGEAHIVPILLSPCDYQGTLISHLQVLPTGGRAVTLWSRRQEAYVDVARNIRTVVEKLLAQKWQVAGDTHYRQQGYEQALSAYEAAFRFNPQLLPVSIRIGELLLHFKRFEEAVTAYDRAIQLDPQNPHLYKDKGEALCSLERFEEAVAVYDRVIELKSDFGLAYLARGKALDARALQAYEEYKRLAAQSYKKAKALESKKRLF